MASLPVEQAPGGTVNGMPLTAPKHARSALRRWPLIVIASPAAVAVWSGWVGLGALCGFGVVHPLPGIVPAFRLNTAITLPVGVEAYGAYALGVWLAPARVPDAARKFARRSAIGALVYGMLGQMIYHLLAAAHVSTAPWPVVMLVSCMPVVTLGFGAALTHLLRSGGHAVAPVVAQPVAPEVAPPVAPLEDHKVAPDPDPLVAPDPDPEMAPVVAPPRVHEPAPEVAPQTVHATVQAAPARRPSKDPEAERARSEYRKSVRAGMPLTDRALAAKFPGRSRNWAKARIREVGDGPRLAEAKLTS
jgi:hypothetical protein